MAVSIDLTPAEIRKQGWEALVSQLDEAKSLRFLLEYEKGQGNYTELRRELFAGQTLEDTLADMIKEGIISEGSPAAGVLTGKLRKIKAPNGTSPGKDLGEAFLWHGGRASPGR